MTLIRGVDCPPAVEATDTTDILNIIYAFYWDGSPNPEVGVRFVAPESGQVIITVSGGARDNTNNNRVFFAPQIFRGTDSRGEEILSPSVTVHGFGTTGASNFVMYGSRESLYPHPDENETPLIPGEVYYARVMIFAEQNVVPPNIDPATADVYARSIIVEPVHTLTGGRAGALIGPGDSPPAAAAGDSTVISNMTSTTFIPGTPVVACTFTAPASGRVKITVGGAMRDDAGLNRVIMAPEVYEGTNASGTLVLGTSNTVLTEVSSPAEATGYYYTSRSSVLDGLTPGATYYARLVRRVTGGSTCDIARRDIIVRPLP